MKVLILPALIIGATCFFDVQTAKATTIDSTSPYFHLAHGEHGGARGFEGSRSERSDGDRGTNTNRETEAATEFKKNNPTDTPENHVRKLDERNAANWADGLGGVDGGGVGVLSGCTTNADGTQNCPAASPTN